LRFALGLARLTFGLLLCAAGLVGASGLAGCELLGVIAANEKRYGSSEVQAEYLGLEGKTFAVVVKADQLIQADFPEVVAKLSADISVRLANEAGAAGFVPPDKVLGYQYNHPRWVAMPLDQLAKALTVQRLVYVELTEYRLQDPGNAYLWQGVAAGFVGVVEADAPIPDEFAFRKAIRVAFPDKGGIGPAELPRAAVNTELARRFTTKASWLFYAHEEKNTPEEGMR
jgi:hypothetical protein